MNQRTDQRYRLVSAKFKEFLVPTLAMAMANNMALFVDSVLVSTFLGISKMPAIQLCFPIVALVNMFYWMLGLGGSLLASNEMSDHNREKACRIYSVSMVTVVLIGIIAAALGEIFSDPIISLICCDPSLTGDVKEYFGVMVPGLPLLCIIMSLSYFARADGRPKTGFYAVLISNAVNLCMDTVLIRFCGMGLAGAALATIIGYVCGILYMLRYILWKDRQFRFVNPFQNTFFSDIRDISAKGFPTASSQLYITLCTQILNTIITVYGGSIGLQTFSVYKNSLFLTYIIIIGTAQTLSPIVSVYAHDGDYDRARYVLKKSIKTVLAGAIALGLVFALFPHIILLLYNVRDAEAADACTKAIRMYVFSYPGLSFFYIMSYYFQSIKRQRLSAVMIALEGLVFPAAFVSILAPLYGMPGAWAGVIAAETVSAIVIIAILYYKKKTDKPETSFLLPAKMAENRYEFTIEMNIGDAVKLSEEASNWVSSRTDKLTAVRTCLALEEMLTGICMNNSGKYDAGDDTADINAAREPEETGYTGHTKGSKTSRHIKEGNTSGHIKESIDAIDVTLRDEDDNIIISIRDMGSAFNPTIADEPAKAIPDEAAADDVLPDEAALPDSIKSHTEYNFDNIAVLNKIAREIKYDRSLGMNCTIIYIPK